MPNRNEPLNDAYALAAALRQRFARIHGQELTADKVAKAKAGHALYRRQVELAGGASCLPARRRVIDNRAALGMTVPAQ